MTNPDADDELDLDPTCSTCEFSSPTFVGDDPDAPGFPVLECRRFPPTLHAVPDADGELQQAWPQVEILDWCGEYQESVAH